MAVSPAGESAMPPWLHGGLGRLEAEQMLMNSGRDGEFLVRSSESAKGAYVVSLWCVNSNVYYSVLIIIIITILQFGWEYFF